MNNSSSDDKSTQFPKYESDRLAQLKTHLDHGGIAHTILVHDQNISTAQDGIETGLGPLSNMAPTFILQTERGYLAAVIRGDTRLSYKKIKRKLGLKNIFMAAPEQVKQLTGSEVGYVALVNPGVQTIIDSRVTEETKIFGGSGEPNHTLQISPQDLITITKAQVFDFTELKDKLQT